MFKKTLSDNILWKGLDRLYNVDSKDSHLLILGDSLEEENCEATKVILLRNNFTSLVVVVYPFNSRTLETEAGRSL